MQFVYWVSNEINIDYTETLIYNIPPCNSPVWLHLIYGVSHYSLGGNRDGGEIYCLAAYTVHAKQYAYCSHCIAFWYGELQTEFTHIL